MIERVAHVQARIRSWGQAQTQEPQLHRLADRGQEALLRFTELGLVQCWEACSWAAVEEEAMVGRVLV